MMRNMWPVENCEVAGALLKYRPIGGVFTPGMTFNLITSIFRDRA
jgi:hypothetical protein